MKVNMTITISPFGQLVFRIAGEDVPAEEGVEPKRRPAPDYVRVRGTATPTHDVVFSGSRGGIEYVRPEHTNAPLRLG
jgi:hypothetical protein